jgi:hypothetical protein
MKKVIRLTESDLIRIVKRVINEQTNTDSNLEGALKGLYEEVKNTINAEIDAKIKTNPKFPKNKISVRMFTTTDKRTGEPVNTYQFLYGPTKLDVGTTVLQLINYKWEWVAEQIKAIFDANKNSNLPDIFKTGNPTNTINVGSIFRTINNWVVKNKSTVITPKK